MGSPELERRRTALAQEFAERQWDLGGLAYEMAIRDHFRLDVLLREAAAMQSVDAELGATERMLRMDQAGAAGSCSQCGALYPRGAVFCWQCGTDLIDRVTVSDAAAHPPAEPAAPAPEAPGPSATPSAPPPSTPEPTAGTRPPGAGGWT